VGEVLNIPKSLLKKGPRGNCRPAVFFVLQERQGRRRKSWNKAIGFLGFLQWKIDPRGENVLH
jgi:hypothetical protein